MGTREQRKTKLRLIHSYQYHDNGTGFNEWKPGTPQYIKDMACQQER